MARLVFVALLAGAAHLFGAAEETTDGVHLPGDPGYYVNLQQVELTEATISPEFMPEGDRFKVTVTDGDVTELHMFLMLDLNRYNPMHCPKILVDGKELQYTPLDQIEAIIPLGDFVGPIKKEVRIKVADPAGPSGNWLQNLMHGERAHEYIFEIVKPPQLGRIVKAQALVLLDSDGKEVRASPAFNPGDKVQDKYSFMLGPHSKNATLRFECPQIPGSSQEFEGEGFPAVATHQLDFSFVYGKRIHVACRYMDAEWAPTMVTRGYALDIARNVGAEEVNTISALFRGVPSFGYCDAVGADDANLKFHPKEEDAPFGMVMSKTGFVCRANRDMSMFVATFSSRDGGALHSKLINCETQKAIEFNNAIPAMLAMKHERQYFRLHVRAGPVGIIYPVVILWPAECSSAKCPARQGPKLPDPLNAREHMCLWEECSEQDNKKCCVDKATCDTYSAGCPPNQQVRPDGADVVCDGVVCSLEKDQDTCCMDLTTTTFTTTSTTVTTTSTQTSSTSTFTASTSSTTNTTTTVTTVTDTASTTATKTDTTTTGTVPSTSTTKTTTTPTTTTTSTTMVCTETDKVWLPLDMPGEMPTIEENYHDCQRRCHHTQGCEHFAFWRSQGHCHLQGAGARREQWGFGFDAGPPLCTPINQLTTTTVNPVPEDRRCIQHGVTYAPLMPFDNARRFQGTEEEATSACQRFCEVTVGCAQFEFDLILRTCNLAGEEALPYPGAPATVVSGPPICDGVDEELNDFILKSAVASNSRGLRRPTGGPVVWFGGYAPTILALGGLAAVVAVSSSRLGRQNDLRLRTPLRASDLHLVSGEEPLAAVVE